MIKKDKNLDKNKFKPKNPQKYVGNKLPIFRSSWELQFMKLCDDNRQIKAWASEGIKIPYIDPFTGKRRTYIPDFLVQYIDNNGNQITELIEIKPLSQSSVKAAKRSKRNQYAAIINEAKWASARQFCKEAKIVFRVLTEKDIFYTGKA